MKGDRVQTGGEIGYKHEERLDTEMKRGSVQK
jgi:hypothetical protein